MKHINVSKIIIIALLIIIASFSAISLTGRAYLSGQRPNTLMHVLNDGTGTVDQLFTKPGAWFDDKLSAYQNQINAADQNAALKKKLVAQNTQDSQLSALEKENAALRKALNLQGSLANFKTLNATVITRAPSSWNDTLVIDAGTDSGLKTGMAVLADGGVIGRVTQVNSTNSKVELLTGANGLADKVPAEIDNDYGLLASYDAAKNQYVVSNMTATGSFSVGDKVVTSGLGGNWPSALLLGTVISTSGQASDASRKIYVKPAASFYNVRFVSVVLSQGAGS
ncbi:MAG: rod shape-determining protein MreC [Streptococcaceae bacterium]|jgi:rod shape-determining protein MreC|nr:rod shape-determining protein MreC [Streptococcaceae bacterium]